MKRRSILKAAIGACAAILCPWRQVKSSPSWAHEVTWRIGQCELDECKSNNNKQFSRIKSVMRTNSPRRTLVEKLGALGPIACFDVSCHRPVWATATSVFFDGGEKESVVYINDSLAESLTDDQLFDHIMQGFLQSLQINRAVKITARIDWIAGDLNKLGGLSETI